MMKVLLVVHVLAAAMILTEGKGKDKGTLPLSNEVRRDETLARSDVGQESEEGAQITQE